MVASGATSAAEATANFAVDTVQAVKDDPLKFATEVAVGAVIAAAVGAACVGTAGVGCVVIAGVAAGAASSGVGYGMDVGRGKREFSVGELATEMTMGAAIGGLTAGAGRLIPKGGGRTCSGGNSFAPGTRSIGGSPRPMGCSTTSESTPGMPVIQRRRTRC